MTKKKALPKPAKAEDRMVWVIWDDLDEVYRGSIGSLGQESFFHKTRHSAKRGCVGAHQRPVLVRARITPIKPRRRK